MLFECSQNRIFSDWISIDMLEKVIRLYYWIIRFNYLISEVAGSTMQSQLCKVNITDPNTHTFAVYHMFMYIQYYTYYVIVS